MKIRAKNLEGVSETLFFPLYMRYLETKKPNGVVSDRRYREIVESIDLGSFDLEDFPRESQILLTQRTVVFDSLTRAYIDKNPNALIVNLGAGLDLRFFEVDNGLIRWIDIDLPAVIALRKRFIEETNRWRFLAASVADRLWIDAIPRKENVLFIAEGLLPYLEKEKVKDLLRTISRKFVNSEMIFDAITSYMLYQANKSKTSSYMGRKIGELLNWTLDDFDQLEFWDLDIALLSEHYPASALEGLMKESLKGLQTLLMDENDETDFCFNIDDNAIAGIIHNHIVGFPIYRIAFGRS